MFPLGRQVSKGYCTVMEDRIRSEANGNLVEDIKVLPAEATPLPALLPYSHRSIQLDHIPLFASSSPRNQAWFRPCMHTCGNRYAAGFPLHPESRCMGILLDSLSTMGILLDSLSTLNLDAHPLTRRLGTASG